MKKYKIQVVKEAKEDLRGIFYYISRVLCEPQIAKRIYKTLNNKIHSLEDMPHRNPLIDEQPYKSRGIRDFIIENYRVLYIVDEKNLSVKILRIVSIRREWQNII